MNLICAATILVGLSNPVTRQELNIIAAAKAGCVRQYPDSPCLKKLIKKEELNYHAICGAKVKK